MFSVQIKKRTPYKEAIDIIYALYVREAEKRFGGLSFGMLWAIAEPVVHVAIFTVMFGMRQGGTETADTPLLILSGIIPYLLFRQTLKSTMTAASANKAVFGYPIIKAMHTVIARVMLDVVVFCSSMIASYIGMMIIFDYYSPPANPHIALMALFASSMFGLGVGFCLMIARTFWDGTDKMVNMIFRPLYFMSAIFYSADIAPPAARKILEANPIVHLIELSRMGVYGGKMVVFDGYFLSGVISVFLFVGIYLYSTLGYRATK